MTPYYDCKNVARQVELKYCIEKNLKNRNINNVVLLIDDKVDVEWENRKLHVHRMNHRPTYLDWVTINRKFGLNDISVMCNTDIYFDDSIALIPEYISGERTFMALSRWDVLVDRAKPHPNPHWSQDAWALRCDDELDEGLLRGLDIPLGIPRCDNKIAYKFAICGWKIVNPFQMVKAYHLHRTEHRTYHKTRDERILGGVAYVHPTDAPGDETRIDIDVWARRTQRFSKITINKSLDNWARSAAVRPSNFCYRSPRFGAEGRRGNEHGWAKVAQAGRRLTRAGRIPAPR